ncbi:helix-turn-helix domain-containing protein [Roseovarius aestuarii]|uniref:Helix-turn-helix domain protein n=1 Tax=Roseovarius aestuarii TaxID=475083 RepID=A0A1X7BXI0_9RHOB|nr:helix-turn-helix domain-containing protein [Roseovarius aestuarii]SMC14323.1 Helix-turn-helix domain protein [Roseovarius aestuarii]
MTYPIADPSVRTNAVIESARGLHAVQGFDPEDAVQLTAYQEYVKNCLVQLVAMYACSKRYLKIPEAADYSGHSRSALYEAHKRGELIFTKFGGATRIEKADLDAFLDSTGVKIEAAE